MHPILVWPPARRKIPAPDDLLSMTPSIACALLFWLLQLGASQLRLDIVFDGLPMTPREEASVMREVAEIWSPYGVDVRARLAPDAPRKDAIQLSVVLAAGNDRDAVYTLGAIQFVEDRPLPSIVMYPQAIAALLSSEVLHARGGPESSPVYQDVVVGRVLGRALAHEIGHYLLRSRQHSATGLMRARPPALTLVSGDARSFRLSPEEVARLAPLRPCAHQ